MAEEPKKDDKKHKTCKSRRETAVQGTNDNSIVSKCSMAAIGYFDDVYLQEFVSKVTRRAPLIHRGYFVRALTIDHILQKFLTLHQGPKQIISLGAGFDSAYFRLKAADKLRNVSFYEVDFPEVVKRKCAIIKAKDILSDLIPGFHQQHTDQNPLIEIHTPGYTLVGVDLTQLNTLEAVLTHCGVDTDRPTLLLSECVLTYMTRRCSSAVLKWASETFINAVFVLYEQINPYDAFGLFMQRHFQVVGSPLRCITAFPTLQSQQERFLKLGWEWTEALDMNQIYTTLVTGQQHHLVEMMEPFDEYEEWHLMSSHYMVMCGYIGDCNKLLQDISQKTYKHLDSTDPDLPSVCVEHVPVSYPMLRFGHSSTHLHGNNFFVTVGGFGEQYGKHRRLIDVVVTDLTTYGSRFHYPSVDPKTIEVNRMHHVICAMKDNSVLLIGGRTSPIRLCHQVVRLSFIGLDNNQSETTISKEISTSDHSEQLLKTNDSIVNNSRTQEETNNTVETESTATNIRNVQDSVPNIENSGECSCDSLAESVSRQCGLNSKVRNPQVSKPANVNKTSKSDAERPECVLGNSVIEPRNPCHRETGKSKNNGNSNHRGARNAARNSSRKNKGKDENKEFVTDGKGGPLNVDISVMSVSGDIPCPRWRHSALVVNRGGVECVFLFGGRTENVLALNDGYFLDTVSGRWSKVSSAESAFVPVPRQAHSITIWGQKVILSGGLDSHLHPLNSVHTFDVTTCEWETFALKGLMLSRYSHSSHVIGEYLVLIGGVNFNHTQPGVALVHLPSLISLEFPLQAQKKESIVMLHRHTSVYLGDYSFVVIGGGGNCFSFGTHLNTTPLKLDLTDCFSKMEDHIKNQSTD
ncbi:tRNA wybutosine-synthesizing protein 4-like [Mizuhopecten yessoensis]|uniref:tRNA wybutosine-synthesizing protein 4 n=1 Tax=Mizuhopecten yessoensis TaxID=6573 RepID=A0A210QQN0_MIZYE|nr:tRNA wybutosine-synthesizing protein 4-like [Mizuhopecten yessoensis]OWF51041.1 Leucine carboxyl methyltransferase 2 [Mizuhopecten yessoensis]